MNFLTANPAGAFMQGQRYAAQADEMKRTRDYNNVLSEHGAGIAAGDPTALNALAQYDPMAVYRMQRQKQQDVRADRADARADQLFQMKVAEYRAGLTAQEAAAQAETIKRGVFAASSAETPEEFDAIVTQFDAPDLVGQFGNREALLRQYMTAAQILEADAGAEPSFKVPDGYQLAVPGQPELGVIPLIGYEPEKPKRETATDIGGRLRYKDDGSFVFPDAKAPQEGFRVATPEEAAQYGAKAGQIDTNTGRFYPINPPRGMRFVSDGQDGFTLTEGPGVGSENGEISVGDAYNPAEVQGTLDLIAEIKNDPSLSRVTGSWQGGGGNDVDNFNVVQRGYYGDKGLAVIQKINQLQSRSWLAARAMLKGGGPITDYESRKAEAAVARLSRAQGDADFVAALTDLEDAITDGMAKLRAANLKAPSQVVDQGSQPETRSQYTFENDSQRQLFEKYAAPNE